MPHDDPSRRPCVRFICRIQARPDRWALSQFPSGAISIGSQSRPVAAGAAVPEHILFRRIDDRQRRTRLDVDTELLAGNLESTRRGGTPGARVQLWLRFVLLNAGAYSVPATATRRRRAGHGVVP